MTSSKLETEICFLSEKSCCLYLKLTDKIYYFARLLELNTFIFIKTAWKHFQSEKEKWKGILLTQKKKLEKKSMHKLDKVRAGRLGFYFSGQQYLPTKTIRREIIM